MELFTIILIIGGRHPLGERIECEGSLGSTSAGVVPIHSAVAERTGIALPQTAHCSGCNRRVQLAADGSCPNGHLRSMLRDVREGELAPAAAAQTAPSPAREAASKDNELLGAVIGKSVVIVPVAAIIAFALWTGYEEAVGSGTPAGMAVLLSIGSLVLTVGGAFVWVAMRKRKH